MRKWRPYDGAARGHLLSRGEVATELELALFWQKGRGVDRPMFSKDGRVLAAGSGYGTGGQVQIWRAPSWGEISAIEKARPAVEARDERRPPR